ncbi:hypothetical protein JJB07_16505 [Tumebacillus sp. ITR2]|uniref:Uncharacterized protein n=1 Tax=Tumebacillus amylolyticus TaxID=2801339 RepID=A0ABS1JD57_9BACL|nr:hypothetical protein [Tumebacillus amylolyticus]MBL0388216.1 hypothetical protein [Tumebacillus amylolyticus]
MAADPTHFKTGLWYGLGVALLCNIIALIYAGVNSEQGGGIAIMLIGVIQVAYIAPLSLLSLFIPKYGKGILTGMWMLAGVTFLLNIIGCGMMASGLFSL